MTPPYWALLLLVCLMIFMGTSNFLKSKWNKEHRDHIWKDYHHKKLSEGIKVERTIEWEKRQDSLDQDLQRAGVVGFAGAVILIILALFLWS